MPFNKIQKFPTVEEILSSMPLPENLKALKKNRDKEIAGIFTGRDPRFILVIGPCSAHQEDAVCEYVARLSRVQEKVKGKIILIPRIYTNKPRTTGTGYKGMLHQPDHQKKPDIAKGLVSIRQMHIRALSESYLPAADEMLYPENYSYLEDILSYVAIGARSVENQQHRLTVSGLDIPVGLKNPTSGDMKVMLDSIFASQQPHIFIYNGWEVETEGNPLAHAVLRGSMNSEGVNIPNYHYEELNKLAKLYTERNLVNRAIIVDTNHSNSGKKYKEQPRISLEIVRSMQHDKLLKEMVKGLMIESFLLEGVQDLNGCEFGKSITDPCLGWDDTEKLIYDLADALG